MPRRKKAPSTSSKLFLTEVLEREKTKATEYHVELEHVAAIFGVLLPKTTRKETTP